MHSIFIIVKKELKRFFTDRRMLISLFLPGIILYLVYSFMGNVMGGMLSADEKHVYKIAINVETDATDLVEHYLKSSETTYEKVDATDLETDKIKVDSGELDLAVYYQKGENGQRDNYTVYYNSTSAESTAIYTEVVTMLMATSSVPIYDVLPTDMATSEDTSKMIINMLLPFLLLTFLFSGCMAVATESIAGEKERGTIATLLITPTKRSHIALGKVIALSITALASATVSFVSVILSLPKLMSGSMGDMEFKISYSVPEYLGVFAVIVITVLMFTVILSLVSTIAKSVKEATSYSMPVMILIMIVGLSGMLGASSSSPIACLIPIYNSVQCMSMIFAQEFNPLCLLFTVTSNFVVILLGIVALAKLFSSEKVMFNK
ncbi:MAG: ABC transporter permease [Clostridia bacterium]|nr:ABC transporter permease [Clostridia bacterium]